MEQKHLVSLKQDLYILVGQYHQLTNNARNESDFAILELINESIDEISEELFEATSNCYYDNTNHVRSSWIKLRKDIVAAATDYVKQASEELLNQKYIEYIGRCKQPNKYDQFYNLNDIEEKRQYMIPLLTTVKHEDLWIGNRAS
ncbi:hypothetical protein [Metabacillus idriensis]|uniref:hypothetical protein n=1 Tax=Metabacillus idriensis TaxID=324768 RepID=UPI00174CDD55|nr:hypothetical protein [Metabacillus idriensis]